MRLETGFGGCARESIDGLEKEIGGALLGGRLTCSGASMISFGTFSLGCWSQNRGKNGNI